MIRPRGPGPGNRTDCCAACQSRLLLLDLRGLAGEIAQIVQLCTADLAAAQYGDLVQTRGMQRESTLHADSVGNTAEGEGLTDAAVTARDADALEGLQTLALAFHDLHHHTEGVADAEVRDVGLELFALDRADNLAHGSFSPFTGRSCAAPPTAERPFHKQRL